MDELFSPLSTREVKIEWTRQLVAQQMQKTERIKKETALQNAKLDAQRVKDVRTPHYH